MSREYRFWTWLAKTKASDWLKIAKQILPRGLEFVICYRGQDCFQIITETGSLGDDFTYKLIHTCIYTQKKAIFSKVTL